MNKVLAGDYQILAQSPDPDTVYTGSPCLAQLPSGRLIASIDVRGQMRVLLRTIIDGHTTGEVASVCSLEDDGERLDYRFVQFYPMPGAQCKFHIVHDEESDLFWTTVCLPTDMWQAREPLRAVLR
ncbi:MAG: hypothetical protein F4X14_07445 [Caldilineaceae bacterium SB0661_bin_32]|uniref:Uncharacterized protein n=1 Tax=Caldilineaceae bacterium SB0661_bin_32 TaxID=2605255 RepID=A0A6B1D4P7_9CHLR|nr:hypothetical protein [Caldilineaceae bacterium SB0661_bin_32]